MKIGVVMLDGDGNWLEPPYKMSKSNGLAEVEWLGKSRCSNCNQHIRAILKQTKGVMSGWKIYADGSFTCYKHEANPSRKGHS